ncbi:MAG: hypothetical protein EOM20_02870 [Spartobacteria bacterium]|nr:hypothetical protein [Spartobacteria bacterium]
MKTPTFILSIPQTVQGMYITDDYIFLSMSFGRRSRSTISTYRNPLKTPPHNIVKLEQGNSYPLWFLDGSNLVKSTYFPPMLEGITGIEGTIAVLTESGATKYQKNGKGPVDHLILIDKVELMQ